MAGVPSAVFRPLIWWQRAHSDRKVACPAFSSVVLGSTAGLELVVGPALPVGVAQSATTRMRMLAWDSPQNSAHWPQYSPGSLASMRSGWTRFGHGVALAVQPGDPERVDDVAAGDLESSTGLPAGITISLAVTIGLPVGVLDRRVVELPPPLLADDGDLEGVGLASWPGRRSS